MHKLLFPAILFLLPCAVIAQKASVTYIDQKAPYKNPNPAIFAVLNLPKIGTTFKVSVPESGHYPWPGSTTGPRSAMFKDYLLAFGTRNPNPNLPVAPLGGYLFLTPTVVLKSNPIANISHPVMSTMSFPIPNSAKLLGMSFYLQVHSRDIECTPPANVSCWNHRYQLSRGAHCVIGK